MPLHRFAFGREAWVLVRFVFPPLDVDVGLDPIEQRLRRPRVAHAHPIDHAERREVLGAEVLTEEGAALALSDERVGGDRDQQPIAQTASMLQMADVTGVHDVETAVAMHEALAPPPGRLAGDAQRIDAEDLAFRVL